MGPPELCLMVHRPHWLYIIISITDRSFWSYKPTQLSKGPHMVVIVVKYLVTSFPSQLTQLTQLKNSPKFDDCLMVAEGMYKPYPRCSMYGIFTNIGPKNHPNVGKYTIHGGDGYVLPDVLWHRGISSAKNGHQWHMGIHFGEWAMGLLQSMSDNICQFL